MVEINLWSSLRRFTDGELTVPVEADTVGQALDALVAKHPGLAPVVEAGVSVTIDGEIVQDRHASIPAGAEVFLMQRLKGG